MRVKLYDIFGDNYIIAVASLAKGSRRLKDEIEISDEEVENVSNIAYQIAKAKEDSIQKRTKKRVMLPMSGNDKKKPFRSVLKCFNIPPDSNLSEILEKITPEEKKCEKVSALSFIKPELYEFGRYPGYVGNRKNDIKIEPSYVMLSVVGWTLTRLGVAPFSRGERVGIHLFPQDIDYSFIVIPNLLKGIDYIPGFQPLTAFTLWLTYKMVSTNAIIDQSRMYVISDAGGMSTASVVSGYSIGVKKILENKIFYESISYMLRDIAADALNPDSSTRSFSIQVSNLIYEVLMGSKRREELLYISNRELNSLINSNISENDKKIYKYAAIVSNKIYSS